MIFLAQPDVIQPSYGNLVFQFQSTGATDPTKFKFRYVVNVFSNQGFITELKITPSTYGWGQCDISTILMNYTASQPLNIGCSGETPLHQSAWGYLDENMIVYDIKVGEEYASTPNGIVVGYDGLGNVGIPDVKSLVRYAYNGVKEWFNGKQFDFQPYWLSGSTGTFPQLTSRFLTNSPRTRYARTTDHITLAALNWYKETLNQFEPINNYARQIYSALFKFYDIDNTLIQTSRSFNVENLCGTRPNCSLYDFYFDLPTNYAEEQVVYLGVGVPQLEDYHNISVPAGVKYWSVELEGTLDQPAPPEPEIEDFDGCSCHTYSYSNTSEEEQITFTYLDCSGSTDTIIINPLESATWCACQNSNVPSLDGERAIDNGLCEICECKTYDIVNSSEFPAIFSYTTCEGDTINDTAIPGVTRICACDGSVVAFGLEVVEVGECPLAFSGDCRRFAVSFSAATPFTYTFTGCCGNLTSVVIPPSTALFINANFPLPVVAGITATDFGSQSVICPPDPIPSGTTIPSGTDIICRNVCDDTLQYFDYTGDPIFIGTFLQFNNTIYELIAEGGGGFIPLVDPLVFVNEAQALSAFPCPIYTTGSCLNTIIISEPFFLYLDEFCSKGDRVLYYMNTFGAWDMYNFREKEDTGFSVQKQTYQSSPYLYSDGWDQSSYYGWASRRNVWSNLVIKSGVLYTSFMPQAESIWLSKELAQSPSVYMINDDGVLEPIVITNTEVVVPNYQINATQYQIEVEYQSSYDTTRQQQE